MSASGSVSTVSIDDNLVLSSDSSSPDDSELELGLGLSLGGGGAGGFKDQQVMSCGGGGQYARILTARDLPSVVSSSSSFSSSSSSLSGGNYVTVGTKRSVDSVAAGSSQVVGWPPIRAYRMNSMVNQAKSLVTEGYNSMIEKNKRKNTVVEKSIDGSNRNNMSAKGRTSLFVKVNMDGIRIGRKVDLNAHSCYETLAQTLEYMFHRPTTTVNATRSSVQEHDIRLEARRPSKLLDGTSDFVLTYEDKEGDWMLIGDVPWGYALSTCFCIKFIFYLCELRMFLSSVKRLRIMRTSEATGLAPRLQESNGRQRNRPI